MKDKITKDELQKIKGGLNASMFFDVKVGYQESAPRVCFIVGCKDGCKDGCNAGCQSCCIAPCDD
jgi:hypothetical protein